MLTVVKLDLSVEEWGEFSWSFRMVNKEYNAQAANFGNNNYNNNNYQSYDAPYNDGWDDPLVQGSGDVGGSTAGGGQIECGTCTLLNPSTATVCEVCNSKL